MKPLADCRLYAFVDSAYLHGREPAELAQQLCDGGADILQLRAKDWTEPEVREAAEAILPITRAAEVPLVINDHWALASELGAEFCHLGQEDFFEPDDDPTPELTFPGPQLGLSSHAPEQAEAALEEDADYIAVGPVFPTPTKPPALPSEILLFLFAKKSTAAQLTYGPWGSGPPRTGPLSGTPSSGS